MRWPRKADGSQARLKRLRAARKKGTHDRIEWEVLRRIFGGCAKCGTPGYAERDHIVPLYQGGSDSLENIQPLCSLCNSRKGPETIDWRPHTHPQWREHFAAVFALMDKPR